MAILPSFFLFVFFHQQNQRKKNANFFLAEGFVRYKFQNFTAPVKDYCNGVKKKLEKWGKYVSTVSEKYSKTGKNQTGIEELAQRWLRLNPEARRAPP